MTQYRYRITANVLGHTQHTEWAPVTQKDDNGQLTLQRECMEFASNGITFTVEVKPITPRPPKP